METKVITSHVPLPLAQKIDKFAQQMDRSRGWIVKQALSRWVDAEEYHHQMTLEGMADVEAGRVVDHEEVAAWLDSLDTDAPLPRPRPKQ